MVFKTLLLDPHKVGLILRKELDIAFYRTPYCKKADILGQIFHKYYLEIVM
jgi:hypothetical protein